jgi:hypothetical protein
MPIQLIILSNIPYDEADEIRNLLEENDIEFYETPNGDWVDSLGALWLNDNSQEIKARELLATFQHDRLQNARTRVNDLEAVAKDKKLPHR